MCLGKACDYDDTRGLVAEFGFTAHARAGGEAAQALKREAGHKARRWVVERAHSRRNRFPWVLIRWEKKVENYFGRLHFVCAWITYRVAGLLGSILSRTTPREGCCSTPCAAPRAGSCA